MSSNPERALSKFCDLVRGAVLNIGDVKESPHTKAIAERAAVTTVSLQSEADFVGDYLNTGFKKQFDAIWCAHCLEHQRNVGVFLEKIFYDLKDDGLLCITVPPMKQKVVGGHLTLWNAGLLLYNLILAGFDCSKAEVLKDGYNITVMVRKKLAELPELSMDSGDIEKLAKYFPFAATQGFNGDIQQIGFEQ